MSRKMGLILSLAAGIFCGTILNTDAADPKAQQMTVFYPNDLKWIAGPSSLPHGTYIAVLEGDMAKPGPFTVRIKFPAGYKLPPNWHPVEERLTVISGVLHVGFGNKMDQTSGKALSANSFALIAPQAMHYGWTTEETIIQISGNGPWDIYYFSPLDDPRKS